MLHDFNMSVAARVSQFDAAHGDCVRVGGWIYYQDGAQREAMTPEGCLVEVPADPVLRLKRICVYREALAKSAKERFYYFRDQIAARLQAAQATQDVFPPSREDMKRLRALRDEAHKLQASLTEAQEELKAIDHEEARRVQVAADNLVACEKLRGELAEIKL